MNFNNQEAHILNEHSYLEAIQFIIWKGDNY